MALMGFGKRPKHRSFDYTPRYYDPEKEDLERRMAHYKGEKSKHNDAEAVKGRIRGSFRKQIGVKYESDHYKKSLRRSRRIVLAVTLGLILLTLYFLLEYLPSFLTAFD